MGKNGFSIDLSAESSRTPNYSQALILAAHTDAENDKAMKFMSMSAGLHFLLLIGIATATLPLVEKVEVETITVDLTDGSGSTSRSSAISDNSMPAESGSPIAQAAPAAKSSPAPKAQSSTSQSNDVTVPKAAARASTPKAATMALPVAKTVPSGPVEVIQPANLNLDDLDSDANLDDSMVEVAKTRSLKPNFDQEFKKVQASKQRYAKTAIQQIEAEANALQSEQDAEIATLARTEKAKSDKAAQTLARMQAENAAALAAARGREEGERLAREKAMAAAALAAKNGNGNGSGSGQGLAAGNSNGVGGNGGAGNGSGYGAGSSTGNGKLATGVPGGIRSVSQLKQVPGNPTPKYAQDERMKKAEGTVVFLAYVSRDGSLVDFRQKKSTGYASLDSKTLDALRKWKFYPGQEGWVEIPMNWSLRGGAKETSALNRVLSRN